MSITKEVNSYPQGNSSEIFLDSIESYLQELVAPVAFDIDQSSTTLKKAWQGLIKRSLLSVRIPQSWAGLELEPETFYLLQQLLSQYSGALAFLQLQHQGSVNAILTSKNEALKKECLSIIRAESLKAFENSMADKPVTDKSSEAA